MLLAVYNILHYDETVLTRQIFWHMFSQVTQSTVFKIKDNSTKLLQRKLLSDSFFKKSHSLVLLAVCNILQYG